MDRFRQLSRAVSKLVSALVLIDLGMSRGVNYSKGALLRIDHQTATELFPDGTKKQLWP